MSMAETWQDTSIQEHFQGNFSYTLYPNRSISVKGFILVGSILVVYSLIASFWFWAQGAWPVALFFGVEYALLLWFLVRHFRRRDLRETVSLENGRLIIRDYGRGDRAGHEWVFQPEWTRVELKDDPFHQNRLYIFSKNQGVRIGDFLSPWERAEFASVLRKSLCRKMNIQV